jgi:hypothetical protein
VPALKASVNEWNAHWSCGEVENVIRLAMSWGYK